MRVSIAPVSNWVEERSVLIRRGLVTFARSDPLAGPQRTPPKSRYIAAMGAMKAAKGACRSFRQCDDPPSGPMRAVDPLQLEAGDDPVHILLQVPAELATVDNIAIGDW